MTDDSKTPEQMAEEYLRYENESYYWAKHAFLAGYQAGQEAMLDAQSRMDSAFDRMLQRAKGNSPKKSNSWISVKERLPEIDKYVLVTHRISQDYTNLKVMEACRISDDQYEIWGDHAILADYVDYWMPLPEPPKEEK